MKPKHKIILYISFMIVPSAIQFILNFFEISIGKTIFQLISFVSFIGFVLALHYILTQSDFRKTIYQRIFYIGYSVLFLGALAKLQHWSWAGLFIMSGIALLIITYSIRFFLKTKKELPDYLKLLFLITFLLGRLMKLQHYGFNDFVSLFSVLVLIFILLIYYHKENQLEQFKKQADDFLY